MDWRLPDVSIGFLYLFPVLLAAAALNTWQILLMAVLCGFLREAFDPLRFAPRRGRTLRRSRSAGYAMTGFFVTALNQRRRSLADHLAEREQQIRLRQEAEQQVRILIETSPLAILTLDQSGRVALANESARELFGFDDESLQGSRRGALPADSLPHAEEPALRRQSAHQCGMQGAAPQRRGLSGPRVALHLPHLARSRGWPPWSGTPARTCATAKARASIR